MPLVVVGDALLDRDLEGTVDRLSPEAPVPVVDDPVERARPGGAGLAAALAAGDGERPVRLVTALADDPPARELGELLADAGVEVVDLGLAGATPEKVRIRGRGQTLLRLDRGGRGDARVAGGAPALAAACEAIAGAAGVLVSDYGRGVAALPELRAAMQALPPQSPLVWDPHPRGDDPMAGALLVTPSSDEAAHFCPGATARHGESVRPSPGAAASPDAAAPPHAADASARDAAAGPNHGEGADAERAAALARRWRAAYVCVTRGARGAVMAGAEGPPLAVPAPRAAGASDPCGAGDRFASRAAMLLAGGELASRAVVGAVAAASAFVEAGGAAGLSAPASGASGAQLRGDADRIGEGAALALSERVRQRGGTVVATGGCFDLLHAGHVSVLRAARSLGDCLIVLLNSDASMRRLKGPDRPLVEQSDRAAVLAALDAVDAVIVFDEDTPAEALARLRPDVWAKGGDYAGRELPETVVLERHGGRAVVLPYVAGRSTTRLIEEVALRGGR